MNNVKQGVLRAKKITNTVGRGRQKSFFNNEKTRKDTKILGVGTLPDWSAWGGGFFNHGTHGTLGVDWRPQPM